MFGEFLDKVVLWQGDYGHVEKRFDDELGISTEGWPAHLLLVEMN